MRGSSADVLGTPDFLVCPGLFDYLDEDSAVATIEAFWNKLASGGLLLVGNFAPHNASRAYMEWIGNWYLILRDATELEGLAARAGVPPEGITVSAEATGSNLVLNAQRVQTRTL